MHPRIPLAFLAARSHCWLMVNLSSTRIPRSLSAELHSSRSVPSLYWCMRLFLPRCRTLRLPLLNLIRFLSAQLSSLSQVTLNGSTAFRCVYHTSQFGVISKPAEGTLLTLHPGNSPGQQRNGTDTSQLLSSVEPTVSHPSADGKNSLTLVQKSLKQKIQPHPRGVS